MKKVLFVATVDDHFKAFHIPYFKFLSENNIEVSVASNSCDNSFAADGKDLGDNIIPFVNHKYNICISRSYSPFINLEAIKQLKKILKENSFKFIHCHTAVGSFVGRIAAKSFRKNGLKVIYTTHGYHFYEGASFTRFLAHYNIEKHLSKFTDEILTINSYDFNIAKEKFHAKEVKLIRGMGYDDEKFKENLTFDKKKIRCNLGLREDELVISFAGELSKRKNQIFLVRLIGYLKNKLKSEFNIKLLLLGSGSMKGEVENLITSLNLKDDVKLLGFVDDVGEVLSITDLYISSAMLEGQGINVLEAMSFGIPVIASTTKGHDDLIKDYENGFLVKNFDLNTWAKKVCEIISNDEIYEKCSKGAKETADNYKRSEVAKDTFDVYKKILGLS